MQLSKRFFVVALLIGLVVWDRQHDDWNIRGPVDYIEQGISYARGAKALISLKGFRVLIVSERTPEKPLTKEQQSIFASSIVRDYLESKCVKVSGTYEYRFFDKDIKPDTKVWQDAISKAIADSKGEWPWILISDGAHGVSCPLPKTVSDLMALLRKYGG